MSSENVTPPTDVVAKYLWSMWRRGRRPDVHKFLRKAGDLPPSQLVAVLRVDQQERWRSGERPSVEAYLEAHPQLRESPEAFSLIYDEFQLRQERGDAIDLQEYCRRFPHYAKRLQEQSESRELTGSVTRALAENAAEEANNEVPADPEKRPPSTVELRESEMIRQQKALQHGANRGATVEVDVPRPLTVPPPTKGTPQIPGYDILAELGRGGMGVVYKARHQALGRLVALKTLRASAMVDDIELGRFRAESKVLAKFQHPNIVQIFEVGEIDGDPFFAVEFVDGGDLASKLRSSLPQPARAALITEKLAEAIHYAHGQGVIHRDLKPANILIGAESVPKIVDFGVAKRVDASKRRTMTGAIFGTPYYMAPEQAEGLTHQVGPTADVYALGAILYEMLTGRPPFRAATVLETLELVRLEEPVPPRQLQPGLSRDLETICLKCLEKDPKKRYASGKSLAADLERFRKGEPILARPVGRSERIWRWCRRNPVVASLLVALALTILVGFTGVTGLWLKARQERAQALANFRIARDAIDRYFTQVSEDKDLKVRGAEPLRKRLLESAKEFYTHLSKQNADDPDLQAELARANARLAWITALTASSANALRLYQEAADQLAPLAQSGSAADLQRDLARIYLSQAELLYDLGRLDEAEKKTQAAVALRSQIATAHPNLIDDQIQLAAAYYSQSLVRLGALRMAEAEQELRQALELLDKLESQAGSLEAYLVLRARCYLALATRLTERSETREALPLTQQALELWDRLGSHGEDAASKDAPLHPYANDLAMTCVQLAGLQLTNLNLAAAEKLYDRALKAAEPLAQMHPTIIEYQLTLAMVHQGRGAQFLLQKRGLDADAALESATAILKRLEHDQPNNVRTLFTLGHLYEKRSEVYKFLGQMDKSLHFLGQGLATWDLLAKQNANNAVFQYVAAKAHFDAHLAYQQQPGQAGKTLAEIRRAAELMETVIGISGADEEYAQYCAHVELELGIQLILHGHAAESELPMRKGAEMLERLAQRKPQDAGLQQQLAIAYVAWCKACHANKHTTDAQSAEQKAVNAFDAYLRLLRNSAPGPDGQLPRDVRYALADAYAFCADQLVSIGRFPAALANWDRALELGPENQRPARSRMRALTLALLGRHQDAVAATDSLAKSANASGNDSYQLALVYVHGLNAASNDSQLTQADKTALMDQYAKKVFDQLLKAKQAGFFKDAAALEGFKKDPLFQGVRARSDFPKELEEK